MNIDTQSTIFELSALKKQLLIFQVNPFETPQPVYERQYELFVDLYTSLKNTFYDLSIGHRRGSAGAPSSCPENGYQIQPKSIMTSGGKVPADRLNIAGFRHHGVLSIGF